MNDKLIKSIYENVHANAQRYWARTSLLRKLYHDPKLCAIANDAPEHIVRAYSHTRESLIDSAVISLTRGFLDQGQDSLSLTRLIPSSCGNIIKNDKKDKRQHEEEMLLKLLYEGWYREDATNGNFVEVWIQLEGMMKEFRRSDKVQRIIKFRNRIVAHNLSLTMKEPPEFAMFYEVGNEIAPIMNKLTALVEGKAWAWEGMLGDFDRSASGFSRVLIEGFMSL